MVPGAPGGARYHLRLQPRHGHARFSHVVEDQCAWLTRQELYAVVAEMPKQRARVEEDVWRRGKLQLTITLSCCPCPASENSSLIFGSRRVATFILLG